MTNSELDVSGPQLKLARARLHIEELNKVMCEFVASRPYRIHVKTNSNSYCLFSEVKQLLPEEVPLIIGDAAHNMRSALDHLICVLVERNRNSPSKSNAFPFGRDEAAFKDIFKRRTNGVSSAVGAAIVDLEPFLGGNSSLYGLHLLDIIDKHRSVVAITRVISTDFEITGLRGGGTITGGHFRVPNSLGCHRHIEGKAKDPGVTRNPDAEFLLLLDEDEPLRRVNAIKTLVNMSTEVESVIRSLCSIKDG